MLGLWGRGGFRKYWREVIMLYDDLFFSRSIKDISSLCRRLPQHSDKFGIDFVGSYDGENITFYYLIQSLPRELNIMFKDRIRRECKSGVRVNFLNYIRGHQIDWESTQMRSRLRVLEQVSSENNSEDVNAYNLHKSIKTIGRQAWIEDSLSYLAVADRQRGRSLLKSSVLMMVSGKRGDSFDVSIKSIENYAKNSGIVLNRVLYDIPDLLRYFSPFSRKPNRNIDRLVSTQVLTDEIVSRYNVYNQGMLGVNGIYFGTDVYSRFPVLKQVKPKDDVAENWLITSETGAGKSHLTKDLIMQLLATNFYGTIMDIEGFEYIPIANFVSHNSKVKVINMAEGAGNYIDPVEISEPVGVEEIDKEAKKMSINFTLAKLKTILGKVYTEDTWVDSVVNDVISETYKKAGVTEDPETWQNAKGYTLFHIFDMLHEMKRKKFRDNEDYMLALDKVIVATSKYFDHNGTRREVFKNRIAISDIIDADLVLCSFGMAGKSPQAVDETQLALMQLGAAQISHQRSIFSKSQGKFNFKIWEEFQRWGKFPDSDKTLGVAVTGGRKLGDVNIIITNEAGQLMKDDRLDILSNITSFLIGAIADDRVREDLCKRLSIPHMKKELDAIAAAKRVEDEYSTGNSSDEINYESEDPLRYSFLCGLDNSKFGIVKVVLPPELQKSRLFKTGVSLEG